MDQVKQKQIEERGEPSGYNNHDAPQGSGETSVKDGPAEKAEGEINPSAPGNTGTTPGTNAELG